MPPRSSSQLLQMELYSWDFFRAIGYQSCPVALLSRRLAEVGPAVAVEGIGDNHSVRRCSSLFSPEVRSRVARVDNSSYARRRAEVRRNPGSGSNRPPLAQGRLRAL